MEKIKTNQFGCNGFYKCTYPNNTRRYVDTGSWIVHSHSTPAFDLNADESISKLNVRMHAEMIATVINSHKQQQ